MFGFGKKNIAASGVFDGMTDCHSHILPGVDDGVGSIEESLKILELYESLGIERVVLTPHIMEDYPLNKPDFLKERFNAFLQEYKGTIKLSLAAEYMLDSTFDQYLASGDLLTLTEGHILVETSYMYAPANFRSWLKEIHSQGYHIILAHPERYRYMKSEDYEYLKEQKIRFQLNLLSLVGSYGKRVQTNAYELLKSESYDFIGSDLHSLKLFEREVANGKISSSTILLLNKISRL